MELIEGGRIGRGTTAQLGEDVFDGGGSASRAAQALGS